jgi:hypothetical protein
MHNADRRRIKKVFALLSVFGLAFWLSAAFAPLPALAQGTACQCRDNTINKPMLCYCGTTQCTKSCPTGHTCSCDTDATRAKQCADLDPCAAPSEEGMAAPTLTINLLPEFSMTNATFSSEGSGGRQISTPWIAQYIGGLYKYAVAIAGVLAAVMLMIGGLQYLASAGNSERVSRGKEMITDSLLGLLLVLGTYILLNTINPNLVNYSALTVSYIEPIKFGFTDFSDEGVATSGSMRDPDAPKETDPKIQAAVTANSTASSTPEQAVQTGIPVELPNSADTTLVDVTKLYKTEKPEGINGKVAIRGTKRAWEKLKAAAKIIYAKGCTVVNATGWGRTGMMQLNGVKDKGAVWSAKCHIFYGCRVSMGKAWCVLQNKKGEPPLTEDQACASKAGRCQFKDKNTPDPSVKPYCDVKEVMHVDATDAWAIETSQVTGNSDKDAKKICGSDNIKCAKHRCQRELIRAWNSLGGGMLQNKSADIKGRSWESWHLCAVANESYCTGNADALFAARGYPFPTQ